MGCEFSGPAFALLVLSSHSVGLLKASFRPAEDICAVRTLWRHRSSLLQMAAEHPQHVQKSLSLMNLQIHHVMC